MNRIIPFEDKTPAWLKAITGLVILILVFTQVESILGASLQTTPTPEDLNKVAYEYDDGTYFGAVPVATVAQHDRNVYSGIIFDDVNIPDNATVTNATMTVYYWNNLNYSYAPVNLLIEGIPGDPSVIYPGLLRAPAVTTASFYTYDISGWDTEGNITLDVTNIIQELHESYSWDPGQNVLIRMWAMAPVGPFTPGSEPTYYRYEISTNLGPSNQIPSLNVTYTQATNNTEWYKGYRIYQEPEGGYNGTSYLLESTTTWRVTGAINEHWLAETENDIIAFAYRDSQDKVSYYIADKDSISTWSKPSDHGNDVYTSTVNEKSSISPWPYVNDSLWLSGGYLSAGNNYERHTHEKINSTGAFLIWNSQIGSHGFSNTMRSTGTMRTPTEYRAVGYGFGTSASYKYYTSDSDTTNTQSGTNLGITGNSEISVSYLGQNKDLGLFLGYQNVAGNDDLRYSVINMTDNTFTATTYLPYASISGGYTLSPGAINDPNAYVMIYNSSSGYLEAFTIYPNGTNSRAQIDQVSPSGNQNLCSILDEGNNDTRIVLYTYDSGVNNITAYNFFNGSWDTTPKDVISLANMTSVHAMVGGDNLTAGLYAETTTALYYIDVSYAFSGGFGVFYVYDENGTLIDTASTIDEAKDLIDDLITEDPANPGAGGFDDLDPWWASRKTYKLFFLLLGIFFIAYPWVGFALTSDPSWIGYILIFNSLGVGFLIAVMEV